MEPNHSDRPPWSSLSPDALADRYFELWNESDPLRRRSLIVELFTADATYTIMPPEQIREIASQPGIGLTATLEARGHGELEVRAASVFNEFVGRLHHRFRLRGSAQRVADAVRFSWEMVSSDQEVLAIGMGFILLAPDGRIRRDYQFIEASDWTPVG